MPTDGAAGGGAPDGFEAFYSASYSRLTAQLHAYLGDATEAEDVVQEAFVRAWQRWSTVKRYEDPVGWVRRVAWNLATSRLRRIRVALHALRSRDDDPVVAPPAPDHVALVAALRHLPDRQRHAMVLHHLADMPVADVAVELGVPKGTVLSWLHRGRAQLAARLSTEEQQPVPGEAPDPSLRRR